MELNSTKQHIDIITTIFDVVSIGLVVAAVCFIVIFIRKATNASRKISKKQRPSPKNTNISENQTTTNQTTNQKTNSFTLEQNTDEDNQLIISNNVLQQTSLYKNKGLHLGSLTLITNDRSSSTKVTAIKYKYSQILIATTNNQIILYKLDKWIKNNGTPEKYSLLLGNDTASALDITTNYYFAALSSTKTIAYYQLSRVSTLSQVVKFPKNILNSNVSLIHVNTTQKQILTAGKGIDTKINVWSIDGEKLSELNSELIQHYSISCGTKKVLIRGWNNKIRLFKINEYKKKGSKNVEKMQQILSSEDQTFSAAIDNRDMFVVTISKSWKVNIWNIRKSDQFQLISSSTLSNTDILSLKPNKCAIHTFQHSPTSIKPILILSNYHGFMITDINFKTLSYIQDIQVSQLHLDSTHKSLILCIANNQNHINLWNLDKELSQIQQIKL